MKTKFKILGCGYSLGVPRIDGWWGSCNKNNIKNLRTRCSAIILKGNNSVLIDTSPDIKKQLVDNNIKKVSSVIYTHEHADQTSGLFELRPLTWLPNKPIWTQNKPINVYSNKKTMKYLKQRFDYCFKSKKHYPLIVKGNLIKKKFVLGNKDSKINFQSFEGIHGATKSVALVFEKTAYISDCNDLAIIKKKELKNLNYLILDCLKFKDNWAHFDLNQCLYIHKKLAPKKTILTNLHADLDYEYLRKNLPIGVLPAYDGMTLNL